MTILLDAQNAPDTLRALLAAEQIEAALTCELQFLTDPLCASNRAVSFKSGAKTFVGLGDLVSVSQVQSGPANLTPVMRYRLALPAELVADHVGTEVSRIAALMSDPAEYEGRQAVLALQLFNAGAPFGTPVVLHTGRLSRPRIKVAPGAPLEFEILAESVFTRKRTAPAGKLTDLDQRARHPGDLGLGFVVNAASEAVDWLNS